MGVAVIRPTKAHLGESIFIGVSYRNLGEGLFTGAEYIQRQLYH